MIKKIIWFLKDYKYLNMKWLGIYILSFFMPFFGFLGNNKFARIIVIISFILFIIFFVLDIIDGVITAIKNNFKYKKTKDSLGISIIFIFIYLAIGGAVLPICQFVYYNFLLRDISFSIEVFKDILIIHGTIILLVHLSCINQNKL